MDVREELLEVEMLIRTEEVYDDNYRFNDKEAKAEQFRQGLYDGLTVEQQNTIRALGDSGVRISVCTLECHQAKKGALLNKFVRSIHYGAICPIFKRFG